jgi:O-antigen ligase
VSVRKIGILTLMLTGAYGIAHKLEIEDVCWLAVLMFGTLLFTGYLAEFALGTFRPWRSDYRFCGTIHPNDQGVQCAVLALAAWLAPWEATRRPWMGKVLIAAALFGLILTKSRTALFALAAAGAVGVILKYRGRDRVLAIAGMASILALGAIAYGFLSFGTLDATADVASMGRRENVSSLTGRLPLWEELVQAADDHPLIGHGHGGFWTSKRILLYSEIFAWQIPHAHNAYLDLVLSVGLIGLTLYLAWVLTGAGVAIGRFQRSNRAAELFVVCLVVFSLVNGLAESKFPEAASGSFVLFLSLATLAMRGTSAARLPAVASAEFSRRFRSVEFGVRRSALPTGQ